MIRFGGILWCASFLLLWWPWAVLSVGGESAPGERWVQSLLSGLHFTTSLCLYDGFLTCTELNHSALLAELALDQPTRTDFLSWSSIGGALGSLSSFAAYVTWSREPGGLGPFRWVCLVVALACAVIFEASSWALDRHGVVRLALAATPVDTSAHASPPAASSSIEEVSAGGDHAVDSGDERPTLSSSGPHHRVGASTVAIDATSHPPHEPKAGGREERPVSYALFLAQLASHPNFRVAVAVSCVQVFDCTFEKNFFAPFLDLLARSPASAGGGDDILRPWRGAVLLLSFLLPHVATIAWAPVIRSRGLAGTLSTIFGVRMSVLLLTAVFSTRGSPMSVMIFMLANRVLSESVCRLFPLLLSDIVDEDAVLHRRPAALSASVIGAAGALSKLSQSFAPMVAFALLPPSGVGGAAVASTLEIKSSSSNVTSDESPEQRVWMLLLAIPTACVTIQLVAWSFYTLHGSNLKHINEARASFASTIDASRKDGITGPAIALRNLSADVTATHTSTV